MHLEQLNIANFGPHERLSVKFNRGLVALLGANGCGKSTIVEAAHACLTNNFGRFAGVREDNVRDLARPTDPSSLELYFGHSGQRYRLLRDIKNSRSRLTVLDSDQPTMTRAGEIQAYLEKNLGRSFGLLSRYVFVEQGEMFSFLSETPGDRAKTYQSLCQTVAAAEVAGGIEVVIDSLPSEDRLTAERQQLDGLNAELETATQALQAAQKAYDQAVAAVIPQEKVDKAKEYVQHAASHDNAKRQLEQVDAQLADAKRLLVTAEADARKWQDAFDQVNADAEVKREAADASLQQLPLIRQAVTEVDKANKLVAKWQREVAMNEAELRQLEERRAAIPSPEVAADVLEKLREEVNAIRATINADAEMLRVLGDSKKCPTCRQVIADIESLRKKTQALNEQRTKQMQAKQSAIAAAEKIYRQLDDLGEVGNAVEVKLSSNERLLAQAREMLTDELIRRSKEDQDPHVRAIEAAKAANAAASQASTQFREASSRRSGAVAKVKQLTESRTELVSRIESLAQFVRFKDSANKVIAVAAERDQELLTAQLNLNHLQTRFDETATRVEAAKLRVHELEGCAEACRTLRFIRDEVMHRTKLPAVVAANNLVRLERRMNEVLQLFGGPFRVSATDDLSFAVHFPGAPARPASRLSGGQKGVLAMAFRIAVSQVFAADIELMVLDEPTAWMDDANVRFMADAMQSYAKSIRDVRQVIIVTHAEQLRPAFDQVIDVSQLVADQRAAVQQGA